MGGSHRSHCCDIARRVLSKFGSAASANVIPADDISRVCGTGNRAGDDDRGGDGSTDDRGGISCDDVTG
ncbi:MAG: hypothetical protein EBV88_01555 [Actinobacteria bacterium]|nr:hypothetical protein [Actinomycetota bacterium]